MLPELQAQLPGSIQMAIRSDRSVSIRESVHDVKFTLVLTVVLVVLVIFLFLQEPVGDDHSQPRAAVLDRRHVRGHVGAQLQPRQPVADGADAVGRVRRRRRHRHAGEHRPAHGDGQAAHAGGARRLEGDRLHHRLDDGVARRGLHPDPVHGRHRRPPDARVRGDDRRGDPGLGPRVADADADAVQPLPEAAALDAARLVLQRDRGILRRVAQELRVDAAADDPLQGRDDGRVGAAAGRHGLPVPASCRRASSPASTPGRSTAASSSRRASATKRTVVRMQPDMEILQQRSERRGVHRRFGRRPPEHRPEAARSSAGQDRGPDHRGAASEAESGARRSRQRCRTPGDPHRRRPGGGRGGGGDYQIALQDPDTEELYRVAPQFEADAARRFRACRTSIPTCSCARRSSPSISIASRSRRSA